MTRDPEYLLLQGDARQLALPSKSVDLCLGSPPYVDCRKYYEDGRDLGIARQLDEWVEWMLMITAEALRVSRGAVIWVAAGKTEDRDYWPACEGLMWEWRKRGGSMYRPCYWHRNGVPGSGGNQWFRADVEYVMCFKRSGELPWADNTAMGHTPKYGPGGEMSNRKANGDRTNPWGGGGTSHGRLQDGSKAKRKNAFSVSPRNMKQPNGSVELQGYIPPVVANPGNLVSTGAGGGGQLGNDLAHENEAPFPEDLVEFFVRSLCPPGGICLDPFSGSGTTVAVSNRLGRHAIGLDLRRSQSKLATRRIAHSLRPVSRLDPAKPLKPLTGQGELF